MEENTIHGKLGRALAEEGKEVGRVVSGRREEDAGLAHPLAACSCLWQHASLDHLQHEQLAALLGDPLEPRSFSDQGVRGHLELQDSLTRSLCDCLINLQALFLWLKMWLRGCTLWGILTRAGLGEERGAPPIWTLLCWISETRGAYRLSFPSLTSLGASTEHCLSASPQAQAYLSSPRGIPTLCLGDRCV